MASRRKKVAKAVPFSSADLATITKANPYIQRLIEDGELRENISTAVDSSRSAYNALLSSGSPQKAVFEDDKLHGHVSSAASAIRDIATTLNDVPNGKVKKTKPKKKGLRLGRKLLLVLVAAGAALALSEPLRNKVLDALFGAEEEFQYTPPAATTSEPPASPITAA